MRIWGLASVVAGGVVVSAAGVWASGSAGEDPALRKITDKPFRTAAIHPSIIHGNGRNDPRGEPMDRHSLVRPEPPAPMFAKLAIDASGSLIASGLGVAGETVSIWHNRRHLATAKVGSDYRWQIASIETLGPGDHRFAVQSGGPSDPLPLIGGEVRVSIPTGSRSPVNITFERHAENEAALKRRAESIGEAASKAFDDFIEKKTAQVRSGNPNDDDEEVSDDGDLREQLLTATQRWLGEAREIYHREIVPRLQYGGGLTLPEQDGNGNVGRTARLYRVGLPTIDGTTKLIQSWFGQAADNYDDEILPRLSGARPRRIVLPTEIPDRPERKPVVIARPRVEERVVVTERRDDADEERRLRAAEERRLAALRARRQQEAEDRRRAEAEADRRRAREARERAEEERWRIERERVLQRQEEQRRAALRREAEDDLRTAEAERRRAEQERLRLERMLREQQRRARRADQERQQLALRQEREQVRAERERQRALEARRRAEGAERERQRRLRTEEDAARRQAEFRISEAWQRARDAANRTVRQFRFRQRKETVTTPAPLPERRVPRQAEDQGQRIALAPGRNPRRSARQDRAVRPKPRRVAQRQVRPVASKSRSARRPSKHRHRRRAVRGYRRRSSRNCRYSSAYRIRVPGKYVVRKGDSLWRISRRHYRHGHRYRIIYRANRRLIRNPNLIYPCQRFHLPRLTSRRRR